MTWWTSMIPRHDTLQQVWMVYKLFTFWHPKSVSPKYAMIKPKSLKSPWNHHNVLLQAMKSPLNPVKPPSNPVKSPWNLHEIQWNHPEITLKSLPLRQEGEDFEGYCQRVESSADWGGELELRALADAMKAPAPRSPEGVQLEGPLNAWNIGTMSKNMWSWMGLDGFSMG